MRGIIDELRETELESLRSEVKAGRARHYLKSLDERGAAQVLIRQQYSGRYLFELLQNANDAAAESGRGGQVRFQLTDEALLVADNGVGFQREHIEAICTLGRSSKSAAKSIGYKGLGFKSVGEITDRPQVVSGQVSFEFDANRALESVLDIAGRLESQQRIPTYAFPFVVDPEGLGSDEGAVNLLRELGFTTVMRFPFRKDVHRAVVAQQLKDSIQPSLMLFLRSVEQLEVSGTEADFSSTVVREPDGPAERVLLETDGRVTEWLVHARQIAVDPEWITDMEAAWKNVKEVSVAIATPLDDSSLPSSEHTFPLHVYFPTVEKSAFPVIMHADWALQLDRTQLSTAPESRRYNHELTTQLVSLLSEVVAPDLALRYPGTSAAPRALTPQGAPTGAGTVVFDACVQALRNVRFLPTQNGAVCSPAEAKLLPKTVPSPTGAHTFCDLADTPALLAAEVEEESAVREFLAQVMKTPALTDMYVMGRLRPPAQPDITDYYNFLLAWDNSVGRHNFVRLLRDVKCISTNAGDVVSPSSRVFFRRKSEAIEISAELPLPIARVPDLDGLEDLLRQAGVRDFEWRQLVTDFLVPMLKEPNLVGDMRTRALDGVRSYFLSQRRGDSQVQLAVASVLLPCRDQPGGTCELRRADATYFGKDWAPNSAAEDIYGSFGVAEFLDVCLPDTNDAANAEREFYEFLGVISHPRILTANPDNHAVKSTFERNLHPHYSHAFWQRWWADKNTVTARECPQGHPQSQQIKLSHVLDRFVELVDRGDYRDLSLLWNEIARNWGKYYEPFVESVFHCRASQHSGERDRSAPSIFAFALRNARWIPSSLDGEWLLSPPGSTWRLATGLTRYVRRLVPIIGADLVRGSGLGLAEYLGVTDGARPGLGSLIDLLQRLADDYAEETLIPTDVVNASRWALNALNDVLGEHPDAPVADVPLLSRQGPSLVFRTRPVVATDPHIREAWSAELPVLESEQEVARVVAYFGLVKLDDHVQVAPEDFGVRPDLQPLVEQAFREAAPWLLALIRSKRPTSEDAFVRRMQRLDFSVCDHLVLRYEYDGQSKQRTEAVAFIATRSTELSGAASRTFGTAHLEIDPERNAPYWYDFGSELAKYLQLEAYGDAFSAILGAGPAERRRFLSSRQIDEMEVEKAREILRTSWLMPANTDDLVDLERYSLPRALSGGDAPAGDPQTENPLNVAPVGPFTSQFGASKLPSEISVAAPPAKELKLEALEVLDGRPASLPTPDSVSREWNSSTRPGSASVVLISETERVAIGRRGEEAALAAEKNRVRMQGLDDSIVRWHSDTNPTAPYDIVSQDEDGIAVYIEVKSTTDSNQASPFYISQAELLEAIRLGSQYVVYRVTSVDSDTPVVMRYRDPVKLVSEGKAALQLSSARMWFGVEEATQG